MLIEEYELEVFTPPCAPGTESWSAVARLKTDIVEVLPYLNATLPGADYNPAAPALIWKMGGHSVAFHTDKIAASNLADRVEAEQVMQNLIRTVNQTWAERHQLEPSYAARQRPTPMAVYKLLPQTNCKQCGQATCFNFALKLVAGQQQPEECPPLLAPACADKLAQLQAMVIAAPLAGG
jgi:ArsR family metal-binding transcriptional regulator